MSNFEDFNWELLRNEGRSLNVEQEPEEPIPLTAEEETEAEPLLSEQEVPSEEPQTQPEQKQVPENWRRQVLSYMHDLIYLLGAILIVSLLLFRIVVVSGTSMNETLVDGDYLLVLSNSFYREPQQGDIVVVSKDSFDNGSPIVKRVIATEGQWVDIRDGLVYVGDSLSDMVALEEDYTTSATVAGHSVSFPLQVEEGCIFCLGDNRWVSHDSRSADIGMIDKNEVIGKVLFLFVPGTNKDSAGNPVDSWDLSRIGVVN